MMQSRGIVLHSIPRLFYLIHVSIYNCGLYNSDMNKKGYFYSSYSLILVDY